MSKADVTSTISRTPLFDGLGQEIHDRLATGCPQISLATNDVLCEQGEPPTAIYILLHGSLDIVITSAEKQQRTVGHVTAPELVGEMQVLSGHGRSASLIATNPCELLCIPRSTVIELLATHPPIRERLATIIRNRSRHNRFVTMLPKLIGSAEPKMLADLEHDIRWCSLERGQQLFRQGEPAASMFVVMTGRLQISGEGPHGPRILGEVAAGECLGEMAVLTSANRLATATALRFTELIEITNDRFEKLAARYPALVLGISRLLTERLRRTNFPTNTSQEHVRTIAVLPAGSDTSINNFCRDLTTALEALGTTRRLHPDMFGPDLGGGDLARTSKEDPQSIRLASLLDELEDLHRFVLYQTETETSPWTVNCLERADLILLVGSSTADPRFSDCETLLERMETNTGIARRRFLVIRQPAETKLPKETSRWLTPRRLDLHLHCRNGEKGDVQRVARYIAGQAVGLVLGGGGARGLAHIGVIKALMEHGVPIDMVGGTSSGGMVGGSYTQGLGVPEMVEEAREVFLEVRPFDAYTVPFLSLLDPRKMDQATRRSYGGIDIEDLWIPYFCVSYNLTQGVKVVHQRGTLWRAIRATTSLPGIAVPLIENGDLLVDGGVIENVPVDTMRQLKAGPNIVVDVSRPTEELAVDCSYEELPSGWNLLWNRLNPFSRNRKFFSIRQIISRVSTISSVGAREHVQEISELLLEPPVSDFGMLEWEALDQLVDLAYQATIKKLQGADAQTALGIGFPPATSIDSRDHHS